MINCKTVLLVCCVQVSTPHEKIPRSAIAYKQRLFAEGFSALLQHSPENSGNKFNTC